MDFTPVDHLSQAVIRLSLRKDARGRAFNFLSSRPVAWDSIVTRLRALGFPVEEVPYDAWLERIGKEGQGNPLFPLLSLLEWIARRARGWPFHLPRLDCGNTRTALAEAGLTMRPAEEFLETTFSYFLKSSFLAGSPAALRR
jgi:hypothetical protein